jgi:hypothetical protein
MRCPSQHGLRVIPAVLDRIQVGSITRPVNHLEALLGQECFYALGGVAGRAILQKVRAAVDVHELQQVVFQHSRHCRVLDSLHSVLAFVPAGALRPPHLGPDALERRLVRIPDLAQSSAVKC